MDSDDLIRLVPEDVRSLAFVAPDPIMVAHVIGPRKDGANGSYDQLCFLLALKGERLTPIWYSVRITTADTQDS